MNFFPVSKAFSRFVEYVWFASPSFSLVTCISVKFMLGCSIEVKVFFCYWWPISKDGCTWVTSKSVLIYGITLLRLLAVACSASPACTGIRLLEQPEVVCSCWVTCSEQWQYW